MKENRVRQSSSTYHPYNRSRLQVNPPGKPVGVIRVGHQLIYMAVSPYRHDFNAVVDQIQKGKYASLPSYELSLFNSCFKNWS
jgi:hypothetical protein